MLINKIKVEIEKVIDELSRVCKGWHGEKTNTTLNMVVLAGNVHISGYGFGNIEV